MISLITDYPATLRTLFKIAKTGGIYFKTIGGLFIANYGHFTPGIYGFSARYVVLLDQIISAFKSRALPSFRPWPAIACPCLAPPPFFLDLPALA
jgi:hypothetical protein